ncbi:hypothetical protein B0H21DRAFT_719948 [Amylocystis lapponica]|nr:hypothetical protein B0H21DRAFT_719948 [Amylocystis lapponica]
MSRIFTQPDLRQFFVLMYNPSVDLRRPWDPAPLTPLLIVHGERERDTDRDERVNNYEQTESSSTLVEFIHNQLPINLIYVPEMRIYGRSGIRMKVEDLGGRRNLTYAILSHRWLPEGEVSFEEMQRWSQDGIRPPPGKGLQKLEIFCNRARALGYKWAWMDTCCIDKRSSSELDESIRSMYRWYRGSAVCIAHLTSTSSLEDMSKDEWFTRGWTLQELLAPSRIKFRVFDAAGANLISDTTGIPVVLLMFREKMVWASRRRTTRIEDTAYSLIGLFDVMMPIAYGEGKKAFSRLQLAILERTSDPDLFIWRGRRNSPSPPNTPTASHSSFVAHQLVKDVVPRATLQWRCRGLVFA